MRNDQFPDNDRSQLRGMTIEETPLFNSVTGQFIPVQRQHIVMSDPHTGAVVVLERNPVIQCWAGDLIEDGRTLVFCSVCGQPSCTRHMVQDPFCGRFLCIPDSRLINVQGLPLRICESCYRQLHDTKLKKFIRFLLGRK